MDEAGPFKLVDSLTAAGFHQRPVEVGSSKEDK
jgi:hypothetical protein